MARIATTMTISKGRNLYVSRAAAESNAGADWTNLVIIPPVVNQLYSWDTDAENQKDTSWWMRDQNLDEGVERTQPVLFNDWSNDGENQLSNSWFAVGAGDLDFSLSKIILPFNDWTTDADPHIPTLGYLLDYEIRDWPNYIILPPPVGHLSAWDADFDSHQWSPWTVDQEIRDWPNLVVFPVPPLPICAQGVIGLAYLVAGMISRYLMSTGTITLAGETRGQITADTDAVGDISSDAGATGSGDFESCG